MARNSARVGSVRELSNAAQNREVECIQVVGAIVDASAIKLLPGVRMSGMERASVNFAPGEDGVCLSSDNVVEELVLRADADRRVVWNDDGVDCLGRIELRSLSVSGVVRIIADGKVRSGHVSVDRLHIERADARGFEERPRGYNVEVVPGAFTLWNRHDDDAVVITADVVGLSAGSEGHPVRGSGVFVAGAGFGKGGRLVAGRLETGSIYSNGGIAPGTPDRIGGGVFVVSGAVVRTVRHHGPVTTYGANDMVLDNWGTVDHWIAHAAVTSFGPSAIGFVNFGNLGRLELNAPLETFGRGARGYNVYDGVVHEAIFDRVATHGDGAVGIQISKPVGAIEVRRGLETFGGVGDSLVKGVVSKLPATAFSVKPGGSATKVLITGGLRSHGDGIEALELHGRIEDFTVRGGLEVPGGGFPGL